MKKIGGCIYMHISMRTNVEEKIKSMIEDAEKVFRKVIGIKDFMEVEIVKIDVKNNKVSFIKSPDWDTAREPLVGDAYMIDLNEDAPLRKRTVKITKSKGQIYHHKWMFVADDYQGFDIEESKKWSEKWQSVIPAEKGIKSRIGYKKYWDEYLKEYGLEVQ